METATIDINGLLKKKPAMIEDIPGEYLVYAGGSQYEITQNDGRDFLQSMNGIYNDIQWNLENLMDPEEEYAESIEEELLEDLVNAYNTLLEEIPENILKYLSIGDMDDTPEEELIGLTSTIFEDIQINLHNEFKAHMEFIQDLYATIEK